MANSRLPASQAAASSRPQQAVSSRPQQAASSKQQAAGRSKQQAAASEAFAQFIAGTPLLWYIGHAWVPAMQILRWRSQI